MVQIIYKYLFEINLLFIQNQPHFNSFNVFYRCFMKYIAQRIKKILVHIIRFHSVLIFELNIPTHKPIQMSH